MKGIRLVSVVRQLAIEISLVEVKLIDEKAYLVRTLVIELYI